MRYPPKNKSRLRLYRSQLFTAVGRNVQPYYELILVFDFVRHIITLFSPCVKTKYRILYVSGTVWIYRPPNAGSQWQHLLSSTKDSQSVHWIIVGFASCVPTRIRSRAQKLPSQEWFAHWLTVHSIWLFLFVLLSITFVLSEFT